MTSTPDSAVLPGPGVDVDALARAVDARMGETITTLKDLVAIPGIAWAAFDPAELARSAEAVAGLLRSLGLPDVRILSAG
ncbi:dipeptidase, partial [Arthrobacter sp. GCM10027362]